MPIYEFRCLECNEIAEFLFSSTNKRMGSKMPPLWRAGNSKGF